MFPRSVLTTRRVHVHVRTLRDVCVHTFLTYEVMSLHNFKHITPMYLKRNTTTRLINLRTLLCMQLLTYETVFEYIVWPIWRAVRRVHCKKKTTLHNVLTYRVIPVCKYSHTRTCLCAMCRHLISICFMTSVVFFTQISRLCHVHAQIHTLKDMFSHTFCLMEMCPSTVWHLVSHYFVWCEVSINVMFTLVK